MAKKNEKLTEVVENKDVIDIGEDTEVIESKENTADDLVEIKLFVDNDKYRDDVVVIVNGNTYMIKRGEIVKVPRFVAEVLKNSEEQDANAVKLMQDLSGDFEDKYKALVN